MEELAPVRRDELTEARKKELEAALNEMKIAAGTFYLAARKIGVHPFLELTGLMNELLKLYEEMLAKGEDFYTEHVRAQPHNMSYIAEKIDCIFGESLQSKPTRRALARTLALKGGWSVCSFLGNERKPGSTKMPVAEKVEEDA